MPDTTSVLASASTSSNASQQQALTSADGTPLVAALAKATRHARRRAFLLVLPLLLFVLLTFAAPITQMLYRSINNPAFSANMPNLVAFFAEHDETGVPGEAGFSALAADLKLAATNKKAGLVGTRVNYELPGARSMFTSAARKANILEPPYKEAIIGLKDKWADPKLWGVMRRASSAHTLTFYLAALDMRYDETGSIVRSPEKQRIYVPLFLRTLGLSALISAICFVLAFPIAHLLATLPLRFSNLLMIFVLLPFWTSLLVRTTSWIVLLQGQGVINNLLLAIGVIDNAGRIPMMYNRAGTIIAMTHILLPFMVLPLYSVMKTIPKDYVRAARSLGANPWTAFWRIYFPQTVPGIGAGVLLVFILAVGYYITPALVGGSSGQLISNLIAFHMQKSLNWSMAAALGAILLAMIIVLYWLYDRLIGIDNMKLG